jgi:hypothetical protein
VHNTPELLAERLIVVGQPVAPTDLAHLDGDLAVAVGGDIREQRRSI